MKIIHIITGLNNAGAEGVLTRLISNDKKNKHIIISLKGLDFFGNILLSKKITVYSMNLNKNYLNIKILFKINEIINEHNPNIIQSWMYHSDLIISILKIFFRIKIPIYWNVRNSNVPIKISNFKILLVIRICAIFSYFVPSKILSCAESIRKEHLKIGYKDIFTIIPNGFDPNLYDHNEYHRNKLRKYLNISNNFVIGIIGRWHPQKNHIFLFKLLNKLKKRKINNWKLVLAGRNINTKNISLLNLIKKYQIFDNCILLDERKRLNKIYNILDITVCTSLYGEGFQNVIAESMLSKVPVVSLDIGDAEYILDKVEDVIPINDENKMIELIAKYYNSFFGHKEFINQKRLLSRNKIISNFSIENMISKYEEVWSE